MVQVPDTTGVESNREFILFPEGWYSAQLLKAEEKTTASGSPYLNVEFEHSNTRRRFWRTLSYKETALWKFQQFKLAIEMGDAETDLDDHYGSSIEIYVIQETYEGKTRNKVKEYRPYGGKDTEADIAVVNMIDGIEDAPKENNDDNIPF